jgi:ribosomal protein S18 acetylase RimI-like enzyme
MNFFPKNATFMKNILGDSAVSTSPIIRSARTEDIDLILEMHHRLSDDSLYKRYHFIRIPSRQEIERIVELNGKNGSVFVAAMPGPKPKIIGFAFYVATNENTAETAFLVEDRYQGQGIGRRLLSCLTQTAIAKDICFFDARVLPTNTPMIHLLRKSGRLVHNILDYGAYEMRMNICN